MRFAATQLLLVSPLLIWVGVRSSSWALRRARSGDARFTALVAYGLPLPLFLLACSLAVSVKDHWAFPAYVPLALLGVLWWKAEGRARMGPFARRLGVSWIACSWVVCLALPLARWAPQPGGTHWDPEHEIGDHAVALARTLDPDGGRVFLFAVNHRDSAEPAWEQRSAEGWLRLPVLAQDVRGRPARQFEHWIDPQQVVGWDGIFALEGIQERPRKLEEVRERFDSVELADAVDLTLGGRVLRRVRLFACRNYLGPRGRDLRVADEPRVSP